MVILNNVEKVGDIVEDDIIQGKNVETTDNTYNELKRLQDLLYCLFTNMNIIKRFFQELISSVEFLQLLRCINLNLSAIFLWNKSSYNSSLTKASNVVAKYFSLLAKIDYTTGDILRFPDLLKSTPSDDTIMKTFRMT